MFVFDAKRIVHELTPDPRKPVFATPVGQISFRPTGSQKTQMDENCRCMIAVCVALVSDRRQRQLRRKKLRRDWMTFKNRNQQYQENRFRLERLLNRTRGKGSSAPITSTVPFRMKKTQLLVHKFTLFDHKIKRNFHIRKHHAHTMHINIGSTKYISDEVSPKSNALSCCGRLVGGYYMALHNRLMCACLGSQTNLFCCRVRRCWICLISFVLYRLWLGEYIVLENYTCFWYYNLTRLVEAQTKYNLW